MVIERLVFQVSPKGFERDFLQADADVWTPWLRQQQGFLNKTTRVLSPGMVEILIFWKDSEDLERASQKEEEMARVENLMNSRVPGTHRLVLSKVPP